MARWRFTPLKDAPRFGAEAEGSVSPDALAALDEAGCSELSAALDDHALIVIRLTEIAEPAQISAFAKKLWGADSCLDFSTTPADVSGLAGRSCTVPGVPEVRLLGNTSDDEGKDSLLCRIG